jgi:hypothetical protein
MHHVKIKKLKIRRRNKKEAGLESKYRCVMHFAT